ncbi:hypothetical protein FIU87_03795 [Bacillus sp. THAF10]|uniref:hypothetical protein n=1 Tax=Bacillus sp. THAF10 TaxID=2587848 RepID=UPI001268C38E|nr:hypothetical protein [Bacillus sp. THAF10]QFT87767.1 hypothetical protein FIU87_03795 [Bacillus sp. THAF10]
MKRILIALAAVTVFFMTSVVPFVHTADAWSPRPWTPKPWELKEWKPEPPAELKEWKPNSTEMKTWELQQWVLVQHEMVSWELNNNPDLTPWEVRNYQMIAWELEQWSLELAQGGNPSGGLDGNTSINSPPVQGPIPLPPGDVNGGENSDPSNDGGTSDDDAKGDGETDSKASDSKDKTGPSQYDAIKFISKDVVGSTVNFADKMVSGTDAEAMKNFSDFQKGMFLSGVKTFTKGNNFFDSTFMVTDIAEESKKSFEAVKNLKLINEMRDLSRAGRIDDALQMAGQVKTYSATNAIVASALLPFSIADTYQNYQKIDGTSGWDRADAIVETIGSAGGVMAGLAAPVSFIPVVGQVAAAGLLAVGTVLTLGSVVYKAARNWRKIKDTAVDTVKSVGEGVKKIGSTIKSWFS